MQQYLFNWKYQFRIVILILLVWYWFSIPNQLFDVPTSTVILDREGQLLGAQIASDEQWRFPSTRKVPEKFRFAIIEFEDAWFNKHPGVNPFALARATWQNLSEGRIVSGGSTLSMQVIRMSRKKPRTLFEKAKEILLATRMEITYTKEEILSFYASNAPFGGNVVGLDAAAWRYFGRDAKDLSWAESATLAVLPNAPSLIFPGKNQDKLLKKRNRLLDKLLLNGHLDSLTCNLAKLESLPGKPQAIPQIAPHLLNRVKSKYPDQLINTTIDNELQNAVNGIVASHYNELKFNEIHNAAVLVVEVESGKVRAYVGNTARLGDGNHGNAVDVIMAPRSSGSILKPILYAAILDAGEMLPNTLIADIPVQLGGYTPKNFTDQYDGAVPASKALSRSLNIPAVKMLQQYNVQRFYNLLKQLGFSTLKNGSDHYGLSLILGGAETTLWDLAGVYASFSRELNHFYKFNGKYNPADWHEPTLFEEKVEQHSIELIDESNISASALWLTYQSLLEVNRPSELQGWKSFTSSQKIAWKTGTSFGFRDAWAIGVTPDYVVGVWVGNADGEGRAGLTGVTCAAPIMFDVFNLLPEGEWFDPPYDEMVQIPVCHQSGHRVSQYCEATDTVWIQKKGLRTDACPYHELIHMDQSGQFRVRSDCYETTDMIHTKWFVLPPVLEYYFHPNHPEYKMLPPYLRDCQYDFSNHPMGFIYPGANNKLYLPIELDGTLGSIIFEVAHQSKETEIYWHLDGEYIGTTKGTHKMPLQPPSGSHELILVDEDGYQLKKKFEIMKQE